MRRVNSQRSGELPQAEFTSAEDLKSRGPQCERPRWGAAHIGSCGGPARESVEKQISLIEEFTAARKTAE